MMNKKNRVKLTKETRRRGRCSRTWLRVIDWVRYKVCGRLEPQISLVYGGQLHVRFHEAQLGRFGGGGA